MPVALSFCALPVRPSTGLRPICRIAAEGETSAPVPAFERIRACVTSLRSGRSLPGSDQARRRDRAGEVARSARSAPRLDAAVTTNRTPIARRSTVRSRRGAGRFSSPRRARKRVCRPAGMRAIPALCRLRRVVAEAEDHPPRVGLKPWDYLRSSTRGRATGSPTKRRCAVASVRGSRRRARTASPQAREGGACRNRFA